MSSLQKYGEGGYGECSKDGCEFKAEISVRRIDTAKIKQVCRSCARYLVETTPGIEYANGKPEVTDYPKNDETSDITEEEIKLELAIRKHIDGFEYVSSRDLAPEMGVSLISVGRMLSNLNCLERVRNSSPYRYKINL